MLKALERWLAAVSSVFAIFGWAVPVSAVIAATVTIWGTAFLWVQRPLVYVPATVFLFCLWTYVALWVIWSRRTPLTVRVAHEYAYSLIPEPSQVNLAKIGPSQDDGFALIYNFRNVGAGPVRLRIEDFRVVIGGMTNDDPPQQPEVTFARMAQKGIRALVKRQVGKGTYEGTATAKILYGPPDSESVRRYTYRVKLNL